MSLFDKFLDWVEFNISYRKDKEKEQRLEKLAREFKDNLNNEIIYSKC